MKDFDLNNLKHLSPLTLVLEPQCGSAIDRVRMEAIQVCAALLLNVEFAFNGTRHRVRYRDLLMLKTEVKDETSTGGES